MIGVWLFWNSDQNHNIYIHISRHLSLGIDFTLRAVIVVFWLVFLVFQTYLWHSDVGILSWLWREEAAVAQMRHQQDVFLKQLESASLALAQT